MMVAAVMRVMWKSACKVLSYRFVVMVSSLVSDKSCVDFLVNL
jgi:hypothetical protein